MATKTRRWWGVVCKGCGEKHPTAMYKKNDANGRFRPRERFKYRCPASDRVYAYVGSEEVVFNYTLTS